jgi:hypothetical protein
MDTDFKAWKSKTNFAVSAANNNLGSSTGLLIQTVP